jgi:hypothetical protein
MKKIFVILILLNCNRLFAQSATGSWFGQADVEMEGIHSNYLTELIIKQKGDEIEGIFGYYFKDVHQSFFIHGTYNARTKEILIKNIPLIYFNTNSTVNSIDCNTDFLGTIIVSKVKKTISGHFYHDGKYKYTCPDLRVMYVLDVEEKKEDSILKNTASGKKLWQPQPDDFVVTSTETKKEEIITSATPSNNPPNTNAPLPLKATDVTPAKDGDDAKKIAEQFKKRKNILSKELVVASDSVLLSFYDNGDIDGDSISVFMNSKVVLTHQGLTARAINIYVKLDSTKDVNEISMFAENLGTIPPNTALMVVSDGVNRYEVYMSSSLTQNSAVRLRRKKVTTL